MKHGKTNATIPKDRDPQEVTLDEAVALIAARIAKQAEKSGKPAAKKKAAPKKKAAAKKKAPAKKEAAAEEEAPADSAD